MVYSVIVVKLYPAWSVIIILLEVMVCYKIIVAVILWPLLLPYNYYHFHRKF